MMTSQEAREHNRHVEPFLRGRGSKVKKSDNVLCGMPSSRHCHSPQIRRVNRKTAADRRRYKAAQAKELEQKRQERMTSNQAVQKTQVAQESFARRIWNRLKRPIW